MYAVDRLKGSKITGCANNYSSSPQPKYFALTPHTHTNIIWWTINSVRAVVALFFPVQFRVWTHRNLMMNRKKNCVGHLCNCPLLPDVTQIKGGQMQNNAYFIKWCEFDNTFLSTPVIRCVARKCNSVLIRQTFQSFLLAVNINMSVAIWSTTIIDQKNCSKKPTEDIIILTCIRWACCNGRVVRYSLVSSVLEIEKQKRIIQN